MTAKKSIVLGSVSLVFLILIFCGALLLPSVQRWLVLRLANGQPGLRLQAGQLQVGPGGLHAEGIHLVKDGLVLEVSSVDVDFSLLKAARSKKVGITRLAIRGVKVDTRQYRPTPTGTDKQAATSRSSPFSGVLKSAQLPVEISVSNVDIEGEAIIGRAGEQPPLQSKFKIRGGGLAPEVDGAFKIAATATDPAANADVSSLDLSAVLNVLESKTNSIDAVKLDFEVVTAGRLLAGRSEKLKGSLDLRKAGDGEDYKVAVAIIGARPLVELNTHYSATASRFEGQWAVAATKAQVAPYLLSAAIPEFSATGQGKFTLDAKTFAQATAQGDLTVKASQMGAIMPQLALVGALDMTTHFEVGYADNTAKINRLNFSLIGAKPILSVETLQAATINFQTRAIVYEKATGDFLRVVIAGMPLTWAKPFFTGLELTGSDFRGEIVVSPAGDGFVLKTTRPLGIEKFTVRQAGKLLLTDAALSLDPTLTYDPKQIVAAISHLIFQTPAGDSASFAINVVKPTDTAVPITFDLAGKAKLVALGAGFPPTGVDSSMAGSMLGPMLSMGKLDLAIDDTAGQVLLSVRTAQTFTVDISKTLITPKDPARDLASVKFGRLPLSLAAPFAGKFGPSGEVTAGDILVGVSGDTIRFKTQTPVQIAKLGLTIDHKPALTNLDFSLGLDGTYSPHEYHVRGVELSVKTGGASVLDVKSEANLDFKSPTPTGTAKIKVTANLASLLGQPIAASSVSLRTGRLTADLDALLGKNQGATGQLTIDQLVPSTNGPALPSLLMTFKTDLTADHHLTIDAPIVLTGANRKSDLKLTAHATLLDTGTKFTANLQSENIFADDFQALTALLPADKQPESPRVIPGKPSPSTSPPAPAKLPPPARDKVAFWKGTEGQAKFTFGQIAYGTYLIQGFQGSLIMDTARMEIPALEGKLADTPFKIAGKVSFDGNQPVPYALTADVDVAGFDTGKFLRATNPKQEPIVESVLTTKAKANSMGLNLDDLIARIQGQAEVTAKGGTMHLLPAALISQDKTAGVLNAVGGMLQASSPGAAAVTQLAAFLYAVPIEDLSVKANRDSSLNIHLTDLVVNSSMLHVQGSGEISNVPDQPITEHPLSVHVELFAAGAVAQLFNEISLLGQPEEKNFYPVNLPITIKGTVGNPDRSELNNALKSVAIKAAAGGLLRLFGK